MNNEFKFPKIKKKLEDFLKDEEGTILRSKAAIVGPVAAGTVLLMSKEMSMTAEAAKFTSHASHRSHSSGTTGNHVSHSNSSTGSETNHASHSNTLPSHSSHSSGTTSGFSHTASTFEAEIRNAENN